MEHLATETHRDPQANGPWLKSKKMRPQNTMTRRCCISSNLMSIPFHLEHQNSPSDNTVFSATPHPAHISAKGCTHIYSPRLLPPKENLMGSNSSWMWILLICWLNLKGKKKGFVSFVKHEGYTIRSHTLIRSITRLELGDVSNIKHYYN